MVEAFLIEMTFAEAEQDALYIIYDPAAALSDRGQAPDRATLGSTILDHRSKKGTRVIREVSPSLTEEQPVDSAAIQTLDLTTLGPTIQALGDTTSLAILLLLAEHEELFAQQIAEHLQIHQSTTSRRLAQLEQTDLVSMRPEGGMKFYRANRQRIKEICQSLLKTFE